MARRWWRNPTFAGSSPVLPSRTLWLSTGEQSRWMNWRRPSGGDMPPAWNGALSALVSRLKSLFSATGLETSGIFVTSAFGLCRLVLHVDVWVDVEVASAAIEQAELAQRAGDSGRILGPATVVSNICRRPFLPECDGPWVELQRDKLARQLVRALKCQSRMWLASGDAALAVATSSSAASNRCRRSWTP